MGRERKQSAGQERLAETGRGADGKETPARGGVEGVGIHAELSHWPLAGTAVRRLIQVGQ